MTAQITEIEKQIAELNKTRRHYKLQSEWHRMMYSLTLKLEILTDVLKSQRTSCGEMNWTGLNTSYNLNK